MRNEELCSRSPFAASRTENNFRSALLKLKLYILKFMWYNKNGRDTTWIRVKKSD